MTSQYITVKELCDWIRLSRSKVYSLISTKEIPHIKVGGKILFDKEKIQQWISENPAYAEQIHPDYNYTHADVIYAIRHELAVTIEDVLARRTRLLFLDARAAINSAEKVAGWMAAELGKESAWKAEQITNFELLAHPYLIQ
jgi:glycerol-3-phosphate dehydrogenase